MPELSRQAGLAGIGPGLLVSLAIAATATLLADHYSGPVMLFALLLGMAMNFLGQVDRCKLGIAFASRTLLRIGVALLGVRITLWEIADLGWRPVLLVVLVVVVTILGSLLLARKMGFKAEFGLLTGGATAICGASAAMAISAALPADERKGRLTGFTIIGVSTLSTVVMIIYPAMAALLGFDDQRAGVFIGASVHDVAQVVGAGYAVSTEAGDTATVVKLMRVAMLLPVIVAIGLWTANQGGHGEGQRPPLLPWFVTAFAVLVIMNSLIPVPDFIREGGSTASRWCLVAAIAALGIQTHFRDMADIGWRPVILMVLETLLIGCLVLGALWTGWI